MSRNSKDGSYYRIVKMRRIASTYACYTNLYPYELLSSGDLYGDQRRKTFIRVVNQTIEKMSSISRKFILNEFFSRNKEDQFWWVEIYSRSSYYRYRANAIFSFLQIFYDLYKETYGFNWYDIVGD